MQKIDELLQQVRSELGSEFISVDVIGMDGLSIATNVANPEMDTAPGAARFAMVMKLASKVSAKLEGGAVVDNLVTTDKAYLFARFLGDSSYFVGIVTTREATLGTVRMIMNEYAPQLWEAIPH